MGLKREGEMANGLFFLSPSLLHFLKGWGMTHICVCRGRLRTQVVQDTKRGFPKGSGKVCNELYPESPTPYRFLNSGLWYLP